MADPVAVYGAVIGTLAAAGAIWNIYAGWRDRASVVVEVSQGLAGYDSEWKVILTAINRGRRPVTLSSAGFDFEDKRQMIIREGQPLPAELGEGKSHVMWVTTEEVRRAMREHSIARPPTHGWFMDQTGSKYRGVFKPYFLDH